jgi:hypothetical protein
MMQEEHGENDEEVFMDSLVHHVSRFLNMAKKAWFA